MKSIIPALLALCLSIILIGCHEPDKPRLHKVIIIGAGISGLEAASVLKANNIDVIILEARNRIGGRILTTTMDGANTDLGAAWLHDIDNNVLTTLANNVGVPLIPTPYNPSDVAIYDTGVLVNPSIVNTIYSYAPALLTSLLNLQYASCGAFSDAIDCFIQANIPPGPVIPYALYFYNVTNASWFAANTNYVSSTVGPFVLNPGSDALPTNGYTNFINKIFNINSLNIKLNTIVNKIDYSNNEVVISTNQGKYRAKYVIVTVPIGVLKTNAIKFVPNLPQDKLLAIQHIGFGQFNKVYLQFNASFWDNSLTLTLPYTSNPLSNYYMIFNIGKFVNKPILAVLNFGDFATALEQLSDSEIINSVMQQIRLIYPTAPDPVSYQITRWGLDPFSNGAYTYPTTVTTAEDYNNLITPVQNKLFFAGEAVNPVVLGSSMNKSGTADAAYTSGQNAGNKIVTIINGTR